MQVQRDPRDVHRYEFVAWRIVGFRALSRCLHNLARRAHTDAIVRRQVDLVIGTAPELRELIAGRLVGELDLFPLAELALEVEDVAAHGRASVVAVLPLDVDRVARRARSVEQRCGWWYCRRFLIAENIVVIAIK